MSTDPCERFRGIIAIEVVGHISGSERTALAAHTEGCTSCRDERRELLRLPDALGAADPDRFDDQELPFALRTAVLDRLAAEGRRQRRHTVRSRLLVGSAAAAAVAVIVAVTALVWPAGATVKTVAMRGEPGVHAVVRLTAEPWGTAMELRESGQPPGQLLSVSTEAASGVWWQTGTYRTAGASVRVTMACALKLSEITRVWVRDSAGTILLRGSLHSYDGGPAA